MNKRIRHHRTDAEYEKVLEVVRNNGSRSVASICRDFDIPNSSFRTWRDRKESKDNTVAAIPEQNSGLTAHQEPQTGVEFAQNLINFAKSYQALVERNRALTNQLGQCQKKLQTLDEIMRQPN